LATIWKGRRSRSGVEAAKRDRRAPKSSGPDRFEALSKFRFAAKIGASPRALSKEIVEGPMSTLQTDRAATAKW